MRDIINATLCENHFLKCDTYTIARNGEGLTPCLSVTIPEGVRDFWVYINFEKSNGETFITPRIDLTDGKIVYNIPSAVLDVDGLLGVQIEFKKDDGATWKSYTKEFAVRRSINAVDDIPEKEDFIAEAQKLLDELSKGGGGSGGNIEIDQTYNPTSANAQSGKAINGAIGDIPTSGTVNNLVDYIEQLRERCFNYTDYKFNIFGEQINGIETGLTSIIDIQNELIARGEGV